MINTDKAPIYGLAIQALKAESKLPEGTRHRQVKYLNNRIEAGSRHAQVLDSAYQWV